MGKNVQQVTLAFIVLLSSLITFYVSIGGNAHDIADIVQTEVEQYASITYVASDIFIPTEAIPAVETFIPPTRETAVFPTEVSTSPAKPTPTSDFPIYVQLKTAYVYEYANVRANPSVDQAIVDKFYRTEKRLLLREEGEWYEIPTAAGTGWIAKWLCTTVQ